MAILRFHMYKCYVLLSLLILSVGCAAMIKDVTFSDEACYVAIRGRAFKTVSDLFLICEDETNDKYLFHAEHGQLVPYKINDFKGSPLFCANFMNGGRVVEVVKEGAHIKISRMYEIYNNELGKYNTIYADIISGEVTNRNIRIDMLINVERVPKVIANKLYIMDKRSLRDGDE